MSPRGDIISKKVKLIINKKNMTTFPIEKDDLYTSLIANGYQMMMHAVWEGGREGGSLVTYWYSNKLNITVRARCFISYKDNGSRLHVTDTFARDGQVYNEWKTKNEENNRLV